MNKLLLTLCSLSISFLAFGKPHAPTSPSDPVAVVDTIAPLVVDIDWPDYTRYAEKNARQIGSRPKAVLFGDSITQNWAQFDPEWLAENNFVGRGISGQTTMHMLSRFRADVIDLEPEYVAILAGINDIARNNGYISIRNIFGNIVSMVELARCHGIKPILCTLTPAEEIGWRLRVGDPRPSIDSLNAMIVSYAAANGIPLADYHSAMVVEGGAMDPRYVIDAVHPNIDGYKVMEAVLLATIRKAETLKVMSFNIRNAGAPDGANDWAHRRDATTAMLKSVSPDVFGVQEAYPEQEAFILETCPEYRGFGVGRDDGADSGERMSVFYKHDEFELLDGGTWWLSETPGMPSVGWDARYPRTATWALLRQRSSGQEFFFVNTHLDHIGVNARIKGLELVMSFTSEMRPGTPLVLLGDFNVSPGDKCLAEVNTLMHDARREAPATTDKASFNGFGLAHKIIDYIYFRDFCCAEEFSVVDESFAGKPYISDHYPISAVLRF